MLRLFYFYFDSTSLCCNVLEFWKKINWTLPHSTFGVKFGVSVPRALASKREQKFPWIIYNFFATSYLRVFFSLLFVHLRNLMKQNKLSFTKIFFEHHSLVPMSSESSREPLSNWFFVSSSSTPLIHTYTHTMSNFKFKQKIQIIQYILTTNG